MSSKRRLTDGVRALIASSFGTLRSGVNYGRVCAEFSETELRECEGLIGLEQPNREFRTAITDAVFLALCLHAAPPKRVSIVRREMKLLGRRAAEAATALQNLSAALDAAISPRLLGEPPEPLASLTAPATLECLYDLTAAARQDADRLKDSGGPTKMAAFRVFIRMLADAFGRATGRRAGLTWSAHRERYEGQFWDLIDRVLQGPK